MKCRNCPNTSDKVPFVKGKDWCKSCRAQYQKDYRKKNNPDGNVGAPKRNLDIEMDALPPVDLKRFDFSDRPKLNTSLSETLSHNLGALKVRVDFNTARLNAALKSKHATDIEKAETALGRSVDSQSAMLMKVIDKLDLLEGLRTSGNPEGKPISFHNGGAPPAAAIVDCVVPEEQAADVG